MNEMATANPAALLTDIVPDGRCLAPTRDPPGQRSVYIPPGNPERETYRLSTFKDFPETVPVNTCKFASSGFYYTGFSDRVKCFSCGQAVDTWLIGDDVTLPQWHKPDCDFINGRETGNVSIGSLFGRKPQINNGTSSSQSRNHFVLPPRVNGFDNAVASSSNASLRNSPSNVVVATQSSAINNTNGFSSSNSHRHPTSHHLSEEEKRNLKAMFPCQNPINPHMRGAHSRLQTFLDNPGTWPAHRIRATPQEIADAGMYYLGESDRAKCWYCNGGLRNWEQDDNPWEEHAKWFPMCEYVLQQKGPSFVHDIVARFPNLRRPVLYNPSTISATPQVREVLSGPRLSRNGANRVNGVPEIIDPRKKMRDWRRKLKEDMRSSEVVYHPREMGFEDTTIKEVIMILMLLITIWSSYWLIGRVKPSSPFMNDTATTPVVQLTDIVPNERYLFPSRDQARQRRVYIPPGNRRRETYRLSTFLHFPQTVPVNECRFTSSGFYYTGFGDRVKCFSCGQATDSWLIGDDVTLPQWHKSDCDFINGRETGNVPIASLGGRTSCINTGANRNQPRNHSISTNAVASTSNATRKSFPANVATTSRRRVLCNPSTTSASSQLREVQSEPRCLRDGANHVNGDPEISDIRTNMTDREKTNEELISYAQKMGFDNAAIREVIKRKYETSNQSFSSFESLVDALVALPYKDIPNESIEEEGTSAEN